MPGNPLNDAQTHAMLRINDTVKLILSVILCEATGLLSGWLGSAYNNEWLDQLNKPSWYPPGSVFGPVWSVLYLLMGISLWLVWKSKVDPAVKRGAYLIFGIQLFFNFCWSIIFFRFRSPGWALIDIILLVVCIIITILAFARISKPAAWLLVPYICWVCFATCLNAAIWQLN